MTNCQNIRDYYESKKLTKYDSCHKSYSSASSKILLQFKERHANNNLTLDYILSQSRIFPFSYAAS